MLIDVWQRMRRPDDLFDEQGRKGFQELGLTVTDEGITIAQGGRFRELLRRNKIKTPAGEIPGPSPSRMGSRRIACGRVSARRCGWARGALRPSACAATPSSGRGIT